MRAASVGFGELRVWELLARRVILAVDLAGFGRTSCQGFKLMPSDLVADTVRPTAAIGGDVVTTRPVPHNKSFKPKPLRGSA